MAHSDAFFSSLYENLYEKLYKVAYRMLGNQETAKDMAQETFLLALFRQDELINHPNPEGWLMLTLRNLVRNEQRRLNRHPGISLDLIPDLLEEVPPNSLDMMLPKQLSPQERKILIWRFEQRLDYREIANRIGISEAGCRSCVSRAIVKCRKYI